MDKQIIYVLINEAMPGYVKVGYTAGSLEERMKQLDTTGIPLPFECFFAYEVSSDKGVERRLHDAFDDVRVRSSREFFEIAPERVVAALQIADGIDVTPNKDIVETADDQKALDRARKRQESFNFRMVDIEPGAILKFSRDPEITATVIDQKKIQYKDQEWSTSAAAQEILGTSYPLQGPLYWEYEGETLAERRNRMWEA